MLASDRLVIPRLLRIVYGFPLHVALKHYCILSYVQIEALVHFQAQINLFNLQWQDLQLVYALSVIRVHPSTCSYPIQRCLARPKYQDANKLHDFCGKRCAAANKTTCQAPQCSEPVFVDSGGLASKYCSRSHKT
jgi:hypothetical protein